MKDERIGYNWNGRWAPLGYLDPYLDPYSHAIAQHLYKLRRRSVAQKTKPAVMRIPDDGI